MPVLNPTPGSRSVSWSAKPTVASPPWIEEAPDLPTREARERCANGISRELQTGIADACELAVEALPILDKVDRRELHLARLAAGLRDATDVLNSLAVAGASARHASAWYCREIAAEIAASVVK